MRTRTLRALLLVSAALLGSFTVTACGEDSADPQVNNAEAGSAEAVEAMGGQETYDRLQKLYEEAVAAGEDKVTIYGPAATILSPILMETWEEYFPNIELEGIQQFGPTLQERMRAEAVTGKGTGDVVESGSSDIVRGQDSLGDSEPFTGSEIDEQWRGPHGTVAVALTPFAFVYSPSAVTEDELPEKWSDLTTSTWKDRLSVPDPGSGVMFTTFNAMLDSDIWTESELKALSELDPEIVPPTNFSGPLTSVAQQQRDGAFWVAIDQIRAAQSDGAPIDFVFPMQENNVGSGVYAGLLKNAPHPLAAELYINWRLTLSGATAAARGNTYSLLPGAPAPKGLPVLKPEDFISPVPFDRLEKSYGVTEIAIGRTFGS